MKYHTSMEVAENGRIDSRTAMGKWWVDQATRHGFATNLRSFPAEVWSFLGDSTPERNLAIPSTTEPPAREAA
jgi:hypothetical protein